MKVIGVIPARGNSKEIPGKNIKILKDKPLVAYSIISALSSKLDKVIVSTDSKEIAEISKKYGADVIIRPSNLAGDRSTTLSVIQDVISRLNEKFDAVMTLQPTSPLRTVSDIDNSLKIFLNDKFADSLVSVVEVPHNFHPEKLMMFNNKYLTGNTTIKRRQDLPKIYARNGAAIYITRIENLSKYIIGGNILPYFMKAINSFDIDKIEDWEIVEKLL